jgi:hypothetical protein
VLLLRRCAAVAAVILVAGCYTLEPTTRLAPELGRPIALDINDAGRVALGGSMGPEISQVEGRLVQRTPADYLVAVSSIHLVRGGEQTWSGEQVHIKPEFVSSMYERRFSKGRTVALTTVAAAVVTSVALHVILTTGPSDTPVFPTDTAHTVRRPFRLPLRLRFTLP